MKNRRSKAILAALAATCALSIGTVVTAGDDFGRGHEHDLEAKSMQLFGVTQGLDASSTAQTTDALASADPKKLVKLAKQLDARVVTKTAAPVIDMMALWPSASNPEWIIACNEEGTTAPGLQRIRVSDGVVETILTGTQGCDPAHVTPWGTILFGEEAGGGASGGRVYELIDPLNTTGVTLNRATGVFSGGTGAGNFAVRAALGRNSFEGIGILPNGVVYYGNENRPSSGNPGGAYFKFIPATLRDPNAAPIANLNQSPLVGGTIYGLRLGKRGTAPGTDYGQGSNTGLGTWIEVGNTPDLDLQALTSTLKLTGYYRPEDLNLDPVELGQGRVKLVAVNTGNESQDHNWGEVITITDGTVAQASAPGSTPEVQIFVAGTAQQAMMDNVAYQPGRGNWIFHEDGDGAELAQPRNNDLWACLPDGQDDGDQSDGCIRIATLNDLTAEWTGGVFDATGKRFFVSVQHNISGQGVILEITGWK
ncbi:MAG: PhoX family protein [Dehalococcoidia bacterium]|nr:PhoX family protein [Dehalococcoidia bacterium]